MSRVFPRPVDEPRIATLPDPGVVHRDVESLVHGLHEREPARPPEEPGLPARIVGRMADLRALEDDPDADPVRPFPGPTPHDGPDLVDKPCRHALVRIDVEHPVVLRVPDGAVPGAGVIAYAPRRVEAGRLL